MLDADIRFKLKNSFLKKYTLDVHSKVVNELSVGYGDAIIDMAVINGSLHGFEIKSEHDTLNRLPNQMIAYSKTFDYLTIVSAQKHLPHLEKMLPIWWGIVVVEKTSKHYKLKRIRRPKKNKLTDKYCIAQLLWKEELIEILSKYGITKGVKYQSKQILWSLLANSLNKKEIAESVREKLKSRANWKSELPLSENDGYCQLFAKL